MAMGINHHALLNCTGTLFLIIAVLNTPSVYAKDSLPDDAYRLLLRAESCQHYAGEINGDHSARDQEVQQKMQQLECDRISRDLDSMRKKYRNRPKVLHALETIKSPN